MAETILRVLPIITFLLSITVVAELSDRAGVFDVAGHWIARHCGQRMWLLWLGFSLFAITCTVFLSLDTTAVLLTPVALSIARQVGVAPRPFALTTLWIANTGSLLLPVSNLTNLLALHRFASLGVGHWGYVRLALVPAVVAIVVTLVVIAAVHWRDLRARYAVDAPPDPHDPVLLRLAMGVCLVLGPCFALGAPPWLVSVLAMVVLALATRRRTPHLLGALPVPWAMAGGFAALALAVTWAHEAGHLDPVIAWAGVGGEPVDLLRLAGVSAATSNVVNNLPAFLALEPAGTDPIRLMAVLIGVNVGPLVTPWASLATLLWLARCRAAGVQWRLWRLALAGLACAGLSVVTATLALYAVSAVTH